VLKRSPRNSSRHRRPASGLVPGRGHWLSLCLIHCRSRRFMGGCGPAIRAGQEHWRTLVNAQAQSSKACEGATLPWVQIPPPPPLTCKNVGSDSQQAGASCASRLIYWSQLRATYGPSAGISRGCCAWSRTSRTALNGPEHKHARRRSVHRAVQGWRDRPPPTGYPTTYRAHHTK